MVKTEQGETARKTEIANKEHDGKRTSQKRKRMNGERERRSTIKSPHSELEGPASTYSTHVL